MMKKLQLIKMFGAVIVATALLFSCKTNAYPTISLEAPEDGTELVAGHGVHFAATLADGLGLKSYSIQITGLEGEIFSKTWDLPQEKEMTLHHHEITIPVDAASGNYVFTISCVNKANKESKVEAGIRIVRPFSEQVQ